MNKEFEKIIEKLEKELKLADEEKLRCARENPLQFDSAKGYANGVANSIEIVKQEAGQYNNGWIPCSEKLPDVRQDVLVTVKYTGFMGMHGYWIKTGHMEAENDWWGDCAGGEVIAWQPLPKPFQKGDNNENSLSD